DLARIDGEVDVLQRVEVTVVLLDMVNDDERLCHGGQPWLSSPAALRSRADGFSSVTGPSCGAVRERRLVQAHARSGCQVERLRPPVDRELQGPVAERHRLARETARFIAEDPGGGVLERPLTTRAEQILAPHIGGEDLKPRRAGATGD